MELVMLPEFRRLPPKSDVAMHVKALRQSGLLNAAGNQQFDAQIKLLRKVLGVPVAVVSLLEEDKQVFAAHRGLPAAWAERGETPLTHSFCQYVVKEEEYLRVEDARQHPVLKDNLAIDDLGVVAYLGVPLRLPDGTTVGALAAIDGKPRDWTDEELDLLSSVAEVVVDKMATFISELSWRSMFEQLREGIIVGRVVRDDQGRIIDWLYVEVNNAWGELVGIDPKAVVGRTVRDVIPGIEDAWVNEFAEVVETGNDIRFTRQVGPLNRWYDGSVSRRDPTPLSCCSWRSRTGSLHKLRSMPFSLSRPDARPPSSKSETVCGQRPTQRQSSKSRLRCWRGHWVPAGLGTVSWTR